MLLYSGAKPSVVSIHALEIGQDPWPRGAPGRGVHVDEVKVGAECLCEEVCLDPEDGGGAARAVEEEKDRL